MIAGFWGIPMVGSPDQVAQKLIDLHEAGADGIAISFVDYDEGLAQMERRSCRAWSRPACARRFAAERAPPRLRGFPATPLVHIPDAPCRRRWQRGRV